MARGDLYLETPAGVKLYIAQTLTASTSPAADWSSWSGKSLAHGGIQSINRTLTKTPILCPIPDDDPIGVDINIIESDTIRINTIWFDGIGDNSTYLAAENMFLKRGWSVENKTKPYRLTMGDRQYYVMLNTWTADLTGGWGDTIPVSISLSIVQTPATW